MKVLHYRELIVWQKAMQLTKEIYDITSTFPKSEVYGLSSQMRRSAVSVPSNIAEGNNRDSLKEYLHFLSIAQGSLSELETQVTLSRMCEYIDHKEENRIIMNADEIGKMLRGIQIKLNNKLIPKT